MCSSDSHSLIDTAYKYERIWQLPSGSYLQMERLSKLVRVVDTTSNSGLFFIKRIFIDIASMTDVARSVCRGYNQEKYKVLQLLGGYYSSRALSRSKSASVAC